MSEDKTLGYRDSAKPEEIPFKFHIIYTENADGRDEILHHEDFNNESEMFNRILQLKNGTIIEKYSPAIGQHVKYQLYVDVKHCFFGQYKEIEIKTEHFVIYKK